MNACFEAAGREIAFRCKYCVLINIDRRQSRRIFAQMELGIKM